MLLLNPVQPGSNVRCPSPRPAWARPLWGGSAPGTLRGAWGCLQGKLFVLKVPRAAPLPPPCPQGVCVPVFLLNQLLRSAPASAGASLGELELGKCSWEPSAQEQEDRLDFGGVCEELLWFPALLAGCKRCVLLQGRARAVDGAAAACMRPEDRPPGL